jgi:hypothetical protein
MNWRERLEDAVWRALEDGVSLEEIDDTIKRAIEDYEEDQ